jgi:transcription elongation GreA/GreB family factor
MPFKMKPVDRNELAELLADAPQRGRSSRGAELLEEFVAGGETATRVEFGATKERNAVAISVTNAAKRAGSQIWVRKLGGGTGTDLLLVNLSKADAATRKAYENRPRVGRRPSAK